MDDNMYDVKNMNGLERVAHAMHMHEMWQNAGPHFSHLESNPANQSVCSCVVDIEGNGVMEHLRLNALKIREPELFYKKAKDTRGPGYLIPIYSFKIPIPLGMGTAPSRSLTKVSPSWRTRPHGSLGEEPPCPTFLVWTSTTRCLLFSYIVG